MPNLYENVPQLGNVTVSRCAQAKMVQDGIPQATFDKVLLQPIRPDIPAGTDVVWRERDGLRIIVHMNPTPNTGAKLVISVYRVQRQLTRRR